MLQKEITTSYIRQRTSFVINDAKSYIYLRSRGDLAQEGLGGGNFAIAYPQFALLNLLSKVQYFLDYPDRFMSDAKAKLVKELKNRIMSNLTGQEKRMVSRFLTVPRAMDTNEADAFVHLFTITESADVELHSKRRDDDALVIWRGFRNTLAHLATVQLGKGVETFSFEEYWDWQKNSGEALSTDQLIDRIRKLKNRPVFKFREDTNGWVLNVDALTARLYEISELVVENLLKSDLSNDKLLQLSMMVQPDQ